MISNVLAAGIVTDKPNMLAGGGGFEGIVNNIISFLLPTGAIILFVMLLIGGIKYVSAGANPGNVEKARATITYAIIGIIILAMAYLILVLIGSFTGATNITNFEIRVFNTN